MEKKTEEKIEKAKVKAKNYWVKMVDWIGEKPEIAAPFFLFGVFNLFYWVGRIF